MAIAPPTTATDELARWRRPQEQAADEHTEHQDSCDGRGRGSSFDLRKAR